MHATLAALPPFVGEQPVGSESMAWITLGIMAVVALFVWWRITHSG